MELTAAEPEAEIVAQLSHDQDYQDYCAKFPEELTDEITKSLYEHMHAQSMYRKKNLLGA